MLVARLPSLERGAAVGPIAVTDSIAGWESSGLREEPVEIPGLAHGCSWAAGRSGVPRLLCRRVAPPARRMDTAAGGTPAAAGWTATATCRWGGSCTGTDVVGGRPTDPSCLPTSKLSSGPSGLPMLTCMPSWMSTVGTRRPLTNMPLRLPLSIAIHRPWSNRSTRCAREIRGWAMRTSARRSRPMTTSLPAAKVRADPSFRTVSAGGAGRLIATNSIGMPSFSGDC